MRTLFIINCVTPDGSQTIATANYSLNGNDMGTAVFPLSLAVSSLSPGDNEGTVTVTPDPPTQPPLGFAPNCTGSFNDMRTLFIINCVTPDGSQTIATANSGIT
jgi:hypothetical protein